MWEKNKFLSCWSHCYTGVSVILLLNLILIDIADDLNGLGLLFFRYLPSHQCQTAHVGLLCPTCLGFFKGLLPSKWNMWPQALARTWHWQRQLWLLSFLFHFSTSPDLSIGYLLASFPGLQLFPVIPSFFSTLLTGRVYFTWWFPGD